MGDEVVLLVPHRPGLRPREAAGRVDAHVALLVVTTFGASRDDARFAAAVEVRDHGHLGAGAGAACEGREIDRDRAIAVDDANLAGVAIDEFGDAVAVEVEHRQRGDRGTVGRRQRPLRHESGSGHILERIELARRGQHDLGFTVAVDVADERLRTAGAETDLQALYRTARRIPHEHRGRPVLAAVRGADDHDFGCAIEVDVGDRGPAVADFGHQRIGFGEHGQAVAGFAQWIDDVDGVRGTARDQFEQTVAVEVRGRGVAPQAGAELATARIGGAQRGKARAGLRIEDLVADEDLRYAIGVEVRDIDAESAARRVVVVTLVRNPHDRTVVAIRDQMPVLGRIVAGGARYLEQDFALPVAVDVGERERRVAGPQVQRRRDRVEQCAVAAAIDVDVAREALIDGRALCVVRVRADHDDRMAVAVEVTDQRRLIHRHADTRGTPQFADRERAYRRGRGDRTGQEVIRRQCRRTGQRDRIVLDLARARDAARVACADLAGWCQAQARLQGARHEAGEGQAVPGQRHRSRAIRDRRGYAFAGIKYVVLVPVDPAGHFGRLTRAVVDRERHAVGRLRGRNPGHGNDRVLVVDIGRIVAVRGRSGLAIAICIDRRAEHQQRGVRHRVIAGNRMTWAATGQGGRVRVRRVAEVERQRRCRAAGAVIGRTVRAIGRERSGDGHRIDAVDVSVVVVACVKEPACIGISCPDARRNRGNAADRSEIDRHAAGRIELPQVKGPGRIVGRETVEPAIHRPERPVGAACKARERVRGLASDQLEVSRRAGIEIDLPHAAGRAEQPEMPLVIEVADDEVARRQSCGPAQQLHGHVRTDTDQGRSRPSAGYTVDVVVQCVVADCVDVVRMDVVAYRVRCACREVDRDDVGRRALEQERTRVAGRERRWAGRSDRNLHAAIGRRHRAAIRRRGAGFVGDIADRRHAGSERRIDRRADGQDEVAAGRHEQSGPFDIGANKRAAVVRRSERHIRIERVGHRIRRRVPSARVGQGDVPGQQLARFRDTGLGTALGGQGLRDRDVGGNRDRAPGRGLRQSPPAGGTGRQREAVHHETGVDCVRSVRDAERRIVDIGNVHAPIRCASNLAAVASELTQELNICLEFGRRRPSRNVIAEHRAAEEDLRRVDVLAVRREVRRIAGTAGARAFRQVPGESLVRLAGCRIEVQQPYDRLADAGGR